MLGKSPLMLGDMALGKRILSIFPFVSSKFAKKSQNYEK